ncbi:MAG: response regulator transcription factor [Armatimonadetes bacterium]|nr:response regulator transcription factor [Armatimonadota bacterium]
MPRLLIISRDRKEAALLRESLIREGYEVRMTLPDEGEFGDHFTRMAPELILFDPVGDPEAVRRLRQDLAAAYERKDIPILVLSGEGSVAALDAACGMDDFLIRPLKMAEVRLRVKMNLWKQSRIDSEQLLKIGPLLIDPANYEVTVDGETVEMTFKEYELLRFLATHRGRVFTRDSLLSRVWGYDYYGGTRTVDVHIRRLRAKLGPSCENLIETVRNVGYKFRD